MAIFWSGRYLVRAAAWALLTGLLAQATAGADDERLPNVIIVTADGLAWDDLPRHGAAGAETPALDRLASEGMELQRFYVCPVGATTRASLLTGRYHYRTGVAGEANGENVMHGYEITLAEVLRENGYATASIGSWKNGRNWPSNAKGQGFERVVNQGDRKALTDAAIAFCTTQREKPFLCWLSLPSDADTGGVAAIDASLGRLLAAIDAAQLTENCIIWFAADNGSMARESAPEAAAKRALPALFGDRGSVHEGGVRVPCLVRWPGAIPAGSESREISAHIDLLPTLVELTGATFVETLPIDGISLAELLRTGGKPRRWPNRILFTSFTPPGYDTRNADVAVRTGRWLAVREPRSSRTEEPDDRDGWELYDMLADPYQRYNVAAEYWYLAGHLSADFSFWMKYTTENGVAPIATEVGHAEWPIVKLHVDDLPFRAEDLMLATPPRQRSWPVEVIEAGDYRVSIDWGGPALLPAGEMRIALGDSELLATVGSPSGAPTTTSDLGILKLARGVGELQVEISADSSPLAISILRSVTLEKLGAEAE